MMLNPLSHTRQGKVEILRLQEEIIGLFISIALSWTLSLFISHLSSWGHAEFVTPHLQPGQGLLIPVT